MCETKVCVINVFVSIDEIECSKFDVGKCTCSIDIERDRVDSAFGGRKLMRIDVENTSWCTTFVQ